MPFTSDHYKTLELSESATPDEVKKAYRKLARQYHPDQNQGDPRAEEKFKQIKEAYDVLSDPEQRKTYDFRRKHVRPGGLDDLFSTGGPANPGGSTTTGRGTRYTARADGTHVRVDPNFPPFTQAPGADDDGPLGNIFSKIFGQDAPSRDTETDLTITFDQAIQGGPMDIRVGAETLRVTIPKGVADGYKVRFRGKGVAGPGGQRGDLYVKFRVTPSTRFRREGDDLYMRETVSVLDLLFGATRTIQSPQGKLIKIVIEPGTQPAEKLRLKGLGVERGPHVGDLYVEFDPRVPKLDEQQLNLLRSAAELAGLKKK